MGEQSETIVWITGATSGIGQALARDLPVAGHEDHQHLPP